MKLIDPKIELTIPKKADLLISEKGLVSIYQNAVIQEKNTLQHMFDKIDCSDVNTSEKDILYYIYDRAINSNFKFNEMTKTHSFFKKLIKAYKEPVSRNETGTIERSFHTIDHIIEGLNDLFKIEDDCECNSINNVIIAWFYHDVIYNVGSGVDNERMSAFYAFNDLVQMGWSSESASRIFDLIMWTKHSKNPPESDYEAKLIVDIDLFRLSTSPIEDFFERTKKVKQEYSAFTEEEWLGGRIKFWKDFLKMKNNKIFRSYHFEHFNEITISNIKNELFSLEKEIHNS